MSIGSNGMVQGRHAWLWCTNRTKESSLLRGKSGMVQLLSSFMPKIGFFNVLLGKYWRLFCISWIYTVLHEHILISNCCTFLKIFIITQSDSNQTCKIAPLPYAIQDMAIST